jgi:O-methyltransferase involved in polyketide biosynthesis
MLCWARVSTTFALRNPHAGRWLRVFEVDHPSTQDWKLDQVKAAGIPIPDEATFVPLDLE